MAGPGLGLPSGVRKVLDVSGNSNCRSRRDGTGKKAREDANWQVYDRGFFLHVYMEMQF